MTLFTSFQYSWGCHRIHSKQPFIKISVFPFSCASLLSEIPHSSSHIVWEIDNCTKENLLKFLCRRQIMGLLPSLWILQYIPEQLTKSCNTEVLIGIYFIDQIMPDARSFFFIRFCGTDIHESVYLHWVCRNDAPVYQLCQFNGQSCLSGCSRACDNNNRLH